MDTAGLFRAADFAHDPGNRNRTADLDYTAPCIHGALRQASKNRALDITTVVLRLRDRRNRLLDGVPALRAGSRLAGKNSRHFLRQGGDQGVGEFVGAGFAAYIEGGVFAFGVHAFEGSFHSARGGALSQVIEH